MAWQAKFLDAQKRDGLVVYTIGYKNGAQVFTREYSGTAITDASVRQVALAEVANFTNADNAQLSLTVAKGAVIDLTPDPIVTPPAPTAAEVAAAAWLTAYRRVQSLLRGKAAGLTANTQATIDSAVAELNALPYLASYDARL